MNYLLDTCIVSELIKNEPNKKVVNWIDSIDEMKLYLSVITIGEIEKGLSKLPDSKRKSLLSEWLHEDLLIRFTNRIINLDIDTLFQWGKMSAALKIKGLKMPTIDSLIAATVKQNDLCFVTKNIKDFENCGIELLNPWEN